MLKCDLHDYIEIVCLYHYPLKLTLSTGEVLSGTAQTTCYNNERQECLLLKQSDGEQQVVLDDKPIQAQSAPQTECRKQWLL